MHDFDFDIMEKKRIARGARARKCGSKSRKCTLPSDYLTAAQKKGLNGKVRTYNLSGPMTYNTFRAMPDDLQKEYLLKLRNEMDATLTAMGKMMQCSPETVRQALMRHGIPTNIKRMSFESKLRWDAWLKGEQLNNDRAEAPAPAPAPSEAPVSEDKPAPAPSEAPVSEDKPVPTPYMPCALNSCDMQLRGTKDEILATLRTLLSCMGDGRLELRTEIFKIREEDDE